VLYRVYVDEAGDRGISPASSKHFVVSAVIVADAQDAEVRSEHETLLRTLGRQPAHVLHFRKLTHPQKVRATQDIGSSSVAAITSVIIQKGPLGQPLPTGNMAHISRPDPMYLWALRLLLERISWYVDEHEGTEALVTFAHVKHFKAQKLHNYRAALSMTAQVDIRWGVFDGHTFRISDHKQTKLLQLADTAASAVFRAIEPDVYGNTEPRYLGHLSGKIYRRGALTTSYGLKVFPASGCSPGAPLEWLRTF
jgi:Protein of unknown function (DUF3800)